MVSSRAPALVDTDVFSLVVARSNASDSRVPRWREQLVGRQFVISFQTSAEVIGGALANEWGERRTRELRAIIDRTPTIGVDAEVVEAFARLTADCRRAGHPLHGKAHTGDRWIAACAVAKDLPILTGDRIFSGVPRLSLLMGE